METAIRAKQKQVASQLISKWRKEVIPPGLTRAGTDTVRANVKPLTCHKEKSLVAYPHHDPSSPVFGKFLRTSGTFYSL